MSRIRLALLLSILACTGDKGAAGDDTQSGESDADEASHLRAGPAGGAVRRFRANRVLILRSDQ